MPLPSPTSDANVTIGIDVGTQSTKLLLYRPSSSAVIFRSSRAYDLDPILPGTVPSGRRSEQSPSVWFGAVRDVLGEAAAFLLEAGDHAGTYASGDPPPHRAACQKSRRKNMHLPPLPPQPSPPSACRASSTDSSRWTPADPPSAPPSSGATRKRTPRPTFCPGPPAASCPRASPPRRPGGWRGTSRSTGRRCGGRSCRTTT
mmetsp:Transcript_3534/g.7307  ORF Transcript_3534/g.7307 Transcript_3534/m.7307 type:complete len:202 (+) Transcript_3534:133-738(+)